MMFVNAEADIIVFTWYCQQRKEATFKELAKPPLG